MAADSVSVDALLADAVGKLDALTKRMDALETKPGSNNPIKGDDDDDKKSSKDDATASAKTDDDDDDDRGKKDGITAPKTKIKDDEGGSKKTDAAKSSSKVDDGELEIKHGKGKSDAVKSKADDDDDKKDDDDDDKKDDAFPPAKKPKADAKKADDDDDDKKDDDDDDKKDDSARADEVATLRRQIADTHSVVTRLQSLLKPRSDDEHAAFADAQARADAVFNGFGLRAPRPLEGETLIDYRRRLATKLKTHSTTWKNTKLSKLDEETFTPIESQIYADAEHAAANPVDLNAGELRMVQKVDPTTGVRTNNFYGKESFVKQMGRAGRRVASFRTLASQ